MNSPARLPACPIKRFPRRMPPAVRPRMARNASVMGLTLKKLSRTQVVEHFRDDDDPISVRVTWGEEP